jgi:HAD superfamily phosphoserine phosphatase-like hydrolase
MNVYDFDKTIYNGDSSFDLVKYALLKYPAALKTLPSIAWYGIRYFCGLCRKEKFKERVFSFLRYIPDTESFLDSFWSAHEHKLSAWYLKQKSEDDVIVSASSYFALEPLCRKLRVKLIATEVDSKSGKFSGLNCHGEEKVRRFRLSYPDVSIDNFYSDSRSDTPLANNAKSAFIVKKGRLKPWNG